MQFMIYNVDLEEVVDVTNSLDNACKIIAGKLELGFHTLAEFVIYEKKDVQISVEIVID
jgi:hypothetical protein